MNTLPPPTATTSAIASHARVRRGRATPEGSLPFATMKSPSSHTAEGWVPRSRAVILSLVLCGFTAPSIATAADLYVAPGGRGTGTRLSPFGRIQQAIDVAKAGDVVHVRPGVYAERLSTVRGGTKAARVVVRGTGERGSALITNSGRVVTVGHPNITFENMVIDGRYGDDDTIRVASAASGLVLRNVEVRRSTRDLIDIGSPTDVIIEGCLIHHALNAAGGRTDAHGIVAGAVRGLTIRNTDIHTFSGDGFQVDPGREAPGWSDVTLDTVRIWLTPLPAAANGFAAGVVPGENAIDTKASAALPRARLALRNVTAWGFQRGLIANMAAFNLKEHIDARLDGITVYDSEIAFRLRGGGGASSGARVLLQNAVVYRVGTAYRYEDDIEQLRILHNTVGNGVGRVFRGAASSSAGLETRNLLVLGALPGEASHGSNLAVTASAFIDAAGGDYRLRAGAAAIDRGTPIRSVSADRDGVERPQGAAPDVGAYERR